MAQVLPIPLPPVDVVRRLGEMLEPGVPRFILDAGCGTGRNAIHLAELGHFVVGITNDANELTLAQQAAENVGVGKRCQFIRSDLRTEPIAGMFDVVLMNEVTHTMPKTESRAVLSKIINATKQGGLNVISGYVVRPGTANVTNTRACFAPNELSDTYAHAGWDTIFYEILRRRIPAQPTHLAWRHAEGNNLFTSQDNRLPAMD